MVAAENAFGNRLEHLPSREQGALFFTTPHGPWIIQRFTIACSRGWRTGSGSSAQTIRSYSTLSLGVAVSQSISKCERVADPASGIRLYKHSQVACLVHDN